MSYRDDLEAAQARIRALEDELAEARRERDEALRDLAAAGKGARVAARAPAPQRPRPPSPRIVPPPPKLRKDARALLEERRQADEACFAESPTQEHTVTLARTLIELGAWEKARGLLERALAGHFQGCKVTRGDVYLELGRIEEAHACSAEALAFYQRGLRHEPDHVGLNRAVLALGRA